jgi:predicted anti-sigma-YlaC factor YlaD
MNCRDWEERIALHSGGDLPPAEASDTESHLQACASCRDFAAELREHAAWMREVHRELPGTADFAAMRAGVLERLERRRRPAAWGLVWAGGLAAIAALVLLWFETPRREPAKPTPQVAVAKPPVQTVENPLARPVRRRHRAHAIRPKQTPEPLVVKLTTDDPDVVIYLVVDPKGD